MPADKDAAKRRRQARNRQERQNRQARTEGAKRAGTRPSRTPEAVPSRSKVKGGAAAASTTDLAKAAPPQPGSGGLMGKLFPPRPALAEDAEGRPARAPRAARPPSEVVEVDDAPGVRGLLLRLTAQPGGRATVLALLVVIVAAVTVMAFPVWPSSDLTGYGETVVTSALEAGDATDDEIDDAVETLQTSSLEQIRGIDYAPPQAYFIVFLTLLPVVIGVLAARSLLRPTRSRALMWCAFGGVAIILFNQVTGLYFLVAVLAWGFAAYQSAKADKAAMAAAA